MLSLALWLKNNGFRPDQVPAFRPSPMATATAMYHSGLNPLRKISRTSGEKVEVIRGIRQRRLHKAFLRYHDAKNWPELRQALKRMGRADLIGFGEHCLVPPPREGRAAKPHAPAHAPKRASAGRPARASGARGRDERPGGRGGEKRRSGRRRG